MAYVLATTGNIVKWYKFSPAGYELFDVLNLDEVSQASIDRRPSACTTAKLMLGYLCPEIGEFCVRLL